ncbi:XcbB/CpsF family capsular polysaccharide biosynthesis protein [Actinomyces succiniciruminis]|uniref:Alpha/beta hydrolase fold-3 n=1 Tax=Actinomyces succiniciruminis TaxID=1522002 RepID=A0A1L7RMZ0_9ACTO|nr:XcbB/CpsF family capsular polysaccharide biosynthesis protein [Actinomyces succiniciruminis]CED91550.1 Alpha/beta hydrolase fold-3 [Actinomyces succiniciruminis]
MVQVLAKRAIRLCLDKDPGAALSVIDECGEVDFIEVEHGCYVSGSDNLMRVARTYGEIRPVVFALAEHGFFAYASDGRTTRFVHRRRIPSFWQPVRQGDMKVDESGLIYKLFLPEGVRIGSLVVVFSSMSNPFDKASLTRYFEPNFQSISKHLPDGVAVLRIADLDGVVGGFYLPTVNYPRRDWEVRALIDKVSAGLDLEPSRVVVYGASKGGTAALSQVLLGGFRGVVVDPILDDASYESRYNDTHWTRGGVFLNAKDVYFDRLVANSSAGDRFDDARLVLVSGVGSPLFSLVEGMSERLDDVGRRHLFVVSVDERIVDHPHVSVRTLRTVTGLLNMQVEGISVCPGRREIFG